MPQVLEARSSDQQSTEENTKNVEDSTQGVETSLPNPPSTQKNSHLEDFQKKGQDRSLSTPDKLTTNTTKQQPSIEIGSSIMSLTPLQLSQGNPNDQVIFIEDLTPISAEEMPLSDLFFSKKRRAIVKREMHQKYGTTVKRQRILYDRQGLYDTKFSREMVGSLGAFAMANQCSVENLTN